MIMANNVAQIDIVVKYSFLVIYRQLIKYNIARFSPNMNY